MKKESAVRSKILEESAISNLNPKKYFDNINVVMDFSDVRDQKILTGLKDQLVNLKKYLPNLYGSIKNLAYKAFLEHGHITIKFSNAQEKFGSFAAWEKKTKTINIDYNLKHFALIHAMGFELCNANNKKLNNFHEDILTTEYIYHNPKLFYENMHKLAIKWLETEYLSHKELKQMFDNYYLQKPNSEEIRREAAFEVISYTQHYKMSTKEMVQCIDCLKLKGGDVKEFVDAFPGHIEKYEKQVIMFVSRNVNKHHQDILNSLEYSTATEKIDESSFHNKEMLFKEREKTLSKIEMNLNTSYDPAKQVVLNKYKGYQSLIKLKIDFLLCLPEEKSQDDENTDIWCVIGNNSEYVKTCDADSLQAIGDSYHDHL